MAEKLVGIYWKCPTCKTEFVGGLGCSKCPTCGHGCSGMELVDFLTEARLLKLKSRITLVHDRLIVDYKEASK